MIYKIYNQIILFLFNIDAKNTKMNDIVKAKIRKELSSIPDKDNAK